MAGRKTRSFGSLRRLPSGRWQARYRGPDGLLVSAPSTFVRKTDGARWLALTEAELLKDDWIDPEAGRVPLTDYADAWIAERPGLRPKTIQLYRYLLRRHIAPGFTTIGSITEADVRRWRADLLDEGVSPVTTAKAYRLLKSILATAIEDSLIRRNPCRVKGAGTEQSPERPLLTIGQVYTLADATGPRYRAMILLACFGGLRWGELVALRRRDIDTATATVRISRQLTEARGQAPFFAPPKTAAGKRRVILPGTVVAEIQHHLDTQTAAGRRRARLHLAARPAAPAQQLPPRYLGTGARCHRPGRRPLPRPPPCRQPLSGRGRRQPPRADGTYGPRQQPGCAHLSALQRRPSANPGRGSIRASPTGPHRRILWHVCGTRRTD